MKVFNLIVWLEDCDSDSTIARVHEYDVAANKKECALFLEEQEMHDVGLSDEELNQIDDVLKGVTKVKPDILFNDDHVSVWGTNKELMIDVVIDWFEEHQQFLRVVDSKMINNELLKLKG